MLNILCFILFWNDLILLKSALDFAIDPQCLVILMFKTGETLSCAAFNSIPQDDGQPFAEDKR